MLSRVEGNCFVFSFKSGDIGDTYHHCRVAKENNKITCLISEIQPMTSSNYLQLNHHLLGEEKCIK